MLVGELPMALVIVDNPDVANRSTPTVARRLVASTLRRLREQAQMTKADAAKIVEHDASWLTRIESCETRIHTNDLRVLLPGYGLSAGAAEAVMAMARQTRSRSWWQKYSDAMPDWFQLYVGLESDASVIRTYEQQSVPGLLQTEDYARAAMIASPIPPPAADMDRRLQLRMERQTLLDGDDPPHLRVVLDEAVIRRQVGGSKTMRAQLDHLVEVMDRPN
ncbi:MAG: helix-turn-helix domain-containing protein, partial [Micromonosporaceae bacterium]